MRHLYQKILATILLATAAPLYSGPLNPDAHTPQIPIPAGSSPQLVAAYRFISSIVGPHDHATALVGYYVQSSHSGAPTIGYKDQTGITHRYSGNDALAVLTMRVSHWASGMDIHKPVSITMSMKADGGASIHVKATNSYNQPLDWSLQVENFLTAPRIESDFVDWSNGATPPPDDWGNPVN
ncbi:MAG: hypothetical protein E6Q76_12940 [Rhizobium sp.]|nr:MAG: hypothetical protein E6Q76_12940 [Rhizobium sp.]